jgi:hypothetical protein
MYNGSMKMGRQISVFLELSGVVFLTAREVFAAFGGFFLTTEEGRLVGFLPPSAVFFDRRGGAVKGGFAAFGGVF